MTPSLSTMTPKETIINYALQNGGGPHTRTTAPTKGMFATDVLARPLGGKMATSAMGSMYDTWLNTISERHASAAATCSRPGPARAC